MRDSRGHCAIKPARRRSAFERRTSQQSAVNGCIDTLTCVTCALTSAPAFGTVSHFVGRLQSGALKWGGREGPEYPGPQRGAHDGGLEPGSNRQGHCYAFWALWNKDVVGPLPLAAVPSSATYGLIIHYFGATCTQGPSGICQRPLINLTNIHPPPTPPLTTYKQGCHCVFHFQGPQFTAAALWSQ